MYFIIIVAIHRIQEIIDHEVLASGLPKSATVGVVTYPSSNSTNGSVGSSPNFQTNHIPTGVSIISCFFIFNILFQILY